MDGLSPWELATLKVVYHRCDRTHKGFLDADDVAAMTKKFGVKLSPEEAAALFKSLDSDSDGRVAFAELLSHLTNNEGHLHDLQLRAAMLDQTALVATGAAIPLILKGKTMVVIGSLMFTDPTRLFRDFYVDYATALNSKTFSFTKGKEKFKSVVDGLKKGIRSGHSFRATALVVFAVVVDCAVGACVFFLYTQVRRRLQKEYQNHLIKEKLQEVAATGTSLSSFSSSSSSSASAATKRVSCRKFTTGELTMLEAASGACAGVVAGAIQPLAKRAVSWEWSMPNAVTARNAILRIRHQAAAHAAFFSGFFLARDQLGRLMFKQLDLTRTNTKDAFVTVTAGCCGGGCWRLAQDPLKNRDAFVQEHGIQKWRAMPFRQRMNVRTAGLAVALAQTMPVTGIAFLGFEMSFTLFT